MSGSMPTPRKIGDKLWNGDEIDEDAMRAWSGCSA